MSEKILIKVIGGAVHVYDIPKDVEVEVRDYDVEGVDSYVELHEDEDGIYYIQ